MDMVDGFFRKIPIPLLFCVNLVFAVIVFCLDIVTPHDISFSPFYLLPTIFTAWYGGKLNTVLMALLCTLLATLSVILVGHTNSTFWIYLWDSCSRCATYLIVGLLIVWIRTNREKERNRARRDPLTGLLNRRGFHESLAQTTSWLRRHPQSICLVSIDIDLFKILNDKKGHAAGDLVLVATALAISGSLREIDLSARFGGDEMILLLTEASKEEAKTVLDRIRAETEKVFTLHKWNVSFSAGVVVQNGGDPIWSDLLLRVDKQLYRAKEAGRGITCFEDSPLEPFPPRIFR